MQYSKYRGGTPLKLLCMEMRLKDLLSKDMAQEWTWKQTTRARIFKLLRTTGIDSTESIPCEKSVME
jgi:hypothetical protein